MPVSVIPNGSASSLIVGAAAETLEHAPASGVGDRRERPVERLILNHMVQCSTPIGARTTKG